MAPVTILNFSFSLANLTAAFTVATGSSDVAIAVGPESFDQDLHTACLLEQDVQGGF